MAELPSFFPVYCKAVIDDDTDSGYTRERKRERETHTHTHTSVTQTDIERIEFSGAEKCQI
jgi:hypothetical protein